MISRLKQIAKLYKEIVRSLYRVIIPAKEHTYHKFSYSQEGEDMILTRIFEESSKGFYVDVGAHHPQRFSNTYYFYLQGWSGINIDAMPDSMKLFKKIRPRDINLEIPISDSEQALTYYAFNEPALNSFSKEISNARDGLNQYKIISQKEMLTLPLAKVLDKYLSPGQSIDFLTIDVEGLDYQVLNSNNWERYRPKVVLVEEPSLTLEELKESKIFIFMSERDYQLYGKTTNTLIFTSKSEIC